MFFLLLFLFSHTTEFWRARSTQLDLHPQRRPEKVTKVTGYQTEFLGASVIIISFPCVKKMWKCIATPMS